MKNIKNLKVYKNMLAYLIAGGIGIAGISISGPLFPNEEEHIIEVNSDEKASPTYTPKINPTSTPIPTATPAPTPVVVDYPKNTYGYVTKSLKLKKDSEFTEKTKNKLPIYHIVKMINKTDDKVLVKVGKEKGYIKEKNIKQLDEKFVNIDIDKQLLKIIDEDGKTILKTNVVTGTDTNPETRSDRGVFEIFAKDEDRYLRGPGYSTHVNYFAPYNGGEGLHDASWRSTFGGEIYKSNGSHGCINLPVDVAPKVYKNVKIGTKVIVHD